MMNMTSVGAADKEYEIRSSDLTSLSSLAVTDRRVRDPADRDARVGRPARRPEDRLAREEARGKFRRAFERLISARTRLHSQTEAAHRSGSTRPARCLGEVAPKAG
jgi:hypothetical protein